VKGAELAEEKSEIDLNASPADFLKQLDLEDVPDLRARFANNAVEPYQAALNKLNQASFEEAKSNLAVAIYIDREAKAHKGGRGLDNASGYNPYFYLVFMDAVGRWRAGQPTDTARSP
jgi:hypothetical protein